VKALFIVEIDMGSLLHLLQGLKSIHDPDPHVEWVTTIVGNEV